jgi:hypothetical protein
VNRRESLSLMDNLATHTPVSTHLRVLSFILVDQVEIIFKICSCSTQPPPHSCQQTPHAPSHQDRSGAPLRSNSPVRPNGCFNCGEFGHYANICPKRNMQTPQKGNGLRFAPYSFGLSATIQHYFSLRTNQLPPISQQHFSLRTN